MASAVPSASAPLKRMFLREMSSLPWLIVHCVSMASLSNFTRGSSNTPGKSRCPWLMLTCALPPASEMSKSAVPALMPGRPGCWCGRACGPAACDALRRNTPLGNALSSRPVTRPLALKVRASMAPSAGICQRASSVSTRPLGANDAISAWVLVPSGKRLAIWAMAARSSLSAFSVFFCSVVPAVPRRLKTRLPPGHCRPSGVSKRRFSVENSKPSASNLPPTRPMTDLKTSGCRVLPSCTSTSCMATSSVVPLICPLLTSAQARRLPLPARGSTSKVSGVYFLICETSAIRPNSAYS